MLKKNFGFIKCCDRIVDVFFHINALKPDSKPLELNADVRFVPVMDVDTNKVCTAITVYLRLRTHYSNVQ